MTARIMAVAVLAVRSAVRSRLFISLLVVLLAVLVVLPLTIEGDGTLDGTVRILLNYTLGLTAIVLAAATLWSSCAGIAREIEERHIRLIAVKPVRKSELWLGKWLGLLMLNAVLLLTVGAATYGLLQWRVRSYGDADAVAAVRRDILLAQRRVAARPDDIEADVRRRFHEALESPLAAVVPAEKLRHMAERRVLSQRAVVPPGGTKTWAIDVLEGIRGDAPAVLRVHFAPALTASAPVSGIWRLRAAASGREHIVVMREHRERTARIPLPAELLNTGDTLNVRFAAAETGASTVVFDPDHGVELLVRETTFESNLVRALLVIYAQLALLAALGLAAGTCFSFPVAAFFASVVVGLALTGHYFKAADVATIAIEDPAQELGAVPAAIQKAGEVMLKRLEVVTGPAVAPRPLGALSDGILIPWADVGGVAARLGIVYVVILGALSTLVLSRRELAMP